MRAVELPILRAGQCVAVTIERAELAGQPIWVVTMRESVGRPPQRRWHPDESAALAYAAEQADRHGLMLFDLRTAEE